MGPLVAIGGISIASDAVKEAEHSVNRICRDAGIPKNEKFKWSPGRELWMHKNLTGDDRKKFFTDVFHIVDEYKCILTVVIEDTNCKYATNDAKTPEEDVARMYLERVHGQLNHLDCDGIVIVDRPSGGRGDEDQYLLDCLEIIQDGTEYLNPEKFATNVVSSSSKYIRLLQVADVVVACTLSAVAGEKEYAPDILKTFRHLFDGESRRIGGIGVKIHPDYKYVNLYHWVIGDKLYARGSGVWLLPKIGHNYFYNADDC